MSSWTAHGVQADLAQPRCQKPLPGSIGIVCGMCRVLECRMQVRRDKKHKRKRERMGVLGSEQSGPSGEWSKSKKNASTKHSRVAQGFLIRARAGGLINISFGFSGPLRKLPSKFQRNGASSSPVRSVSFGYSTRHSARVHAQYSDGARSEARSLSSTLQIGKEVRSAPPQ